MVSSSKVMFRLDSLREKSLETINSRIETKQAEVDSFDDEAASAERVKEWRKEQEKKVKDLAKSLKDTDDYRLSRFSIDPIPEADVYERRRAIRDLESMKATRDRIVAKSDSLVPDEEGNIALTKTQLQEFFGL